MTIRVPWLDKTFDFGFPLDGVDDLLRRVAGAPDRLATAMEGLPRETLVRRGDDDAWSIQEHVGHLIDLEALHLGRLDDYDLGKDFLGEADLSNRRTEEANHRGRRIEALLNEFTRVRGLLVRRLRAMHPERFGQTAIHPRLNVAMRIADMLLFVAEHDDHHLETIADLAAASRTGPVSPRTGRPPARPGARTDAAARAVRRAG